MSCTHPRYARYHLRIDARPGDEPIGYAEDAQVIGQSIVDHYRSGVTAFGCHDCADGKVIHFPVAEESE